MNLSKHKLLFCCGIVVSFVLGSLLGLFLKSEPFDTSTIPIEIYHKEQDGWRVVVKKRIDFYGQSFPALERMINNPSKEDLEILRMPGRYWNNRFPEEEIPQRGVDRLFFEVQEPSGETKEVYEHFSAFTYEKKMVHRCSLFPNLLSG